MSVCLHLGYVLLPMHQQKSHLGKYRDGHLYIKNEGD